MPRTTKNRISARQDWDCDDALGEKADDLRGAIDGLKKELDTVLTLSRRRSNLLNQNLCESPLLACFNYIACVMMIGTIIGLFALAFIHAGK